MIQEQSNKTQENKQQAIISLSYSFTKGLQIDRVLFIDSSYSSDKQEAIQGRFN